MHFAYYCSGHGYGHATRVSALSTHLLQLSPKPNVTIISSAPPHVFSDSMRAGAQYRNAKVDPVVQQPLAYRVDRKKSLEVLEGFLAQRDRLIDEEARWMKQNDVTCVLSDAVFIACAAANKACLPSALITNFTFDSIWSYLTAELVEAPTTLSTPAPLSNMIAPPPHPSSLAVPSAIELEPDVPLAHSVMDPLADRIARDYRNADLLLRLPGYLPFPSFSPAHPLPATSWIDQSTQRFHPSVLKDLRGSISAFPLYESTSFPEGGPVKPIKRQLKEAPLLVRHPAADVYTPEARQRILDSVGVPRDLHDPEKTKIVIVSFGGQVIKRPSHSRNGSRAHSISGTPHIMTPKRNAVSLPEVSRHDGPQLSVPTLDRTTGKATEPENAAIERPVTPPEVKLEKLRLSLQDLPRIATPSHIYVPGAPPASNPSSPIINRRPTFQSTASLYDVLDESEEPEACLLPDGWIAIVCGVAKNWGEEDLPEGFYIAPRDAWMPDITAVGDVLLGKLGYGTCAECVDACTPFVYVPRPLIVEEHGLRELMETSGVGVLLPQAQYELGDWASKIEEAYEKGKDLKAEKRRQGWSDVRKRQADEMAVGLVGWVESWYDGIRNTESELKAIAMKEVLTGPATVPLGLPVVGAAIAV